MQWSTEDEGEGETEQNRESSSSHHLWPCPMPCWGGLVAASGDAAAQEVAQGLSTRRPMLAPRAVGLDHVVIPGLGAVGTLHVGLYTHKIAILLVEIDSRTLEAAGAGLKAVQDVKGAGRLAGMVEDADVVCCCCWRCAAAARVGPVVHCLPFRHEVGAPGGYRVTPRPITLRTKRRPKSTLSREHLLVAALPSRTAHAFLMHALSPFLPGLVREVLGVAGHHHVAAHGSAVLLLDMGSDTDEQDAGEPEPSHAGLAIRHISDRLGKVELGKQSLVVA